MVIIIIILYNNVGFLYNWLASFFSEPARFLCSVQVVDVVILTSVEVEVITV